MPSHARRVVNTRNGQDPIRAQHRRRSLERDAELGRDGAAGGPEVAERRGEGGAWEGVIDALDDDLVEQGEGSRVH